ncbi:MAG: hypothetical protein KBI47_04135 [Armatimonadetes bacterium]|jgi:hypothetical protein|nr:hypothetical protein [Armatimonadota bacterium]MDI9585540.1 cyclophilin-like fold protein [Acidobacteriota bacterium]
MPRIKITAGDVSAYAQLGDGPTAKKVWEALPIEASAQTWGDEIYFGIPVQANKEPDAKAERAVGDLAYWPPGNAFCIFFGPTPMSSGDLPVAASPVNTLGTVEGDATVFKSVRSGAKVIIEAAE